jgi:glycosyltransferase involved in cell wall biosynthesis
VILLLHHRYRVPGGEERAVEDLGWLIGSHMGEEVKVMEQRRSEGMSAATAARGLLHGGLNPEWVGALVRATGARVLHAHNIHPTYGWRALAAAKEAGARVVLHLHNYRLVCANGVCFTQGEDCTRCSGRWTVPGVRLNCRGGSRAEALVYAAGIARQQRRIGEVVDHFIVPSAFALSRLRELDAPVGDAVSVIPSVQREFVERSSAASGTYVLYVGRLTEEKGVQDAVAACALAGLDLVVAGDGPLSVPGSVGRVDAARLAELRAGAAVAVVPSRYEEILPLAALEAMAAGLPVVACAAGGLKEVIEDEGLVPVGDVPALASTLRARFGDAAAGERALARVRSLCAPEAVAARLAQVYDGGRLQ